jgi:hypothetical protein
VTISSTKASLPAASLPLENHGQGPPVADADRGYEWHQLRRIGGMRILFSRVVQPCSALGRLYHCGTVGGMRFVFWKVSFPRVIGTPPLPVSKRAGASGPHGLPSRNAAEV